MNTGHYAPITDDAVNTEFRWGTSAENQHPASSIWVSALRSVDGSDIFEDENKNKRWTDKSDCFIHISIISLQFDEQLFGLNDSGVMTIIGGKNIGRCICMDSHRFDLCVRVIAGTYILNLIFMKGKLLPSKYKPFIWLFRTSDGHPSWNWFLIGDHQASCGYIDCNFWWQVVL